MGLFTPKISARELQYVQTRLTQLQNSVRLVNTTASPEVFFKQLHISLDTLLELQSYEKYKIFKGNRPSEDYQKIIRGLEATVNAFIDRAVKANEQKVFALKTEAAKTRKQADFATKLIRAFDASHSFWTGNVSTSRKFPHYNGPLYTQNNYLRVQSMLKNSSK